MKRLFFYLFITLSIVAPVVAIAATTNDGIMSCNRTNAYAMSVGALSAQGSVYVPTNDAAVTLNSGYLTYLECTLRPIIDRMREMKIADMVAMTNKQFLTGNNGNPMFSQDQSAETLAKQDQGVIKLVPYMKNIMDPSYAGLISSAVTNDYINQTRHQYDDLACSNPVTDSTDLWTALGTYMNNPSCYPLGAYDIATRHIQASNDAIAEDINTQLNRGQGIYPQYQTDSNGNTKIVTPAIVLGSIEQQAVTSGFRQTESANDIGQIVSDLFTGMGTAIMSNIGGLVGIGTAVAGQPSYLDSVSKAASNGVLSSVANLALQTLTAARQVEADYYNTLAGIGTSLTSSAQKIKDLEAACWKVIIPAVCTSSTTSPTYGSNTVTCYTLDNTKLTIATTTDASAAIINAQIQPLASSILTSLDKSKTALDTIDQLITDVSNTTSQTAQSVALDKFNTLVASNAFHTQVDVANLTPQIKAVNDQLTQLLGNNGIPGTLQQTWLGLLNDGTWTPSDTAVATPGDANSAWCNVTNKANITAWQKYWSK